jgi:hypothetical protein
MAYTWDCRKCGRGQEIEVPLRRPFMTLVCEGCNACFVLGTEGMVDFFGPAYAAAIDELRELQEGCRMGLKGIVIDCPVLGKEAVVRDFDYRVTFAGDEHETEWTIIFHDIKCVCGQVHEFETSGWG